MTTSHVERKRSLLQEYSRRTLFAKSFCRRPDLVSRSVDFCCLECSMEEDDDYDDDPPTDTVNTTVNDQTRKLLQNRIRRAIYFTKRLQKRYARRMGRSVRSSEILSDRRRFWEIVFPWLPWDKHLHLDITNGIMALNETLVKSDNGLRLLLSILQVQKQAEFDRECQLTKKGFYRDLQHLEGNSEGHGLFQILCHLRALLPPPALDDDSSTACTASCRDVTNATLSRIFHSVSLTKTVDLVLVTRVCLLNTIKFLFFLLRLVRTL